MAKKYSQFIDFGKDYNNAIKNPYNSANPLTYCMFPTLNSQFFHGSASGGLLYGNENTNCFNFMAERCEKEWDGYCQAYVDVNVDSYWPNQASIDTDAYNNAKQFFNIKPTIGQDLIRNSCYRKFIHVPNNVGTKQPFDYTVANSPIITIYDNYVSGYSLVKNLSNNNEINNDEHIKKMLENPYICFDVLARIYLGYKRKEKNINIQNTILEKFFIENEKILNNFVQQAIKFVPSFNINNTIWISQCCKK